MADTTPPNATEQATDYTLDISRQDFSGVTFVQGSEGNGRSPNDLVGELPGGETFVLADYLVLVKATDGALPPPLTLNDGTVIEGAEVLAALGEVNLDLVGDPAAGGQAVPNATGNASYTVYFPEGLGDYLLHGPFAPDPSAFGAYDQLDDLVGQRTLGTADIEVLTSIKISGYEDAQPNQHLGDDTLDLMKAEITMVPSNEATYRISLTLNDIPDGALLYVGGTTPADIVTVAGGSYTVDLSGLSTTDQEALLDSVYMIAPPDSDIDFTLSAVAVFGGPTGDLDVPVETLVIVDAVAEQADLLDQNDATAFSYTYNEDQSLDDPAPGNVATTPWTTGETGWSNDLADGNNYVDAVPVYGIGFQAAATDVDQGRSTPTTGDDRGSEYIAEITIDPVSTGDAFGTAAFSALLDGTVLADGITVDVRAEYIDAAGDLTAGIVEATVALVGGSFVLTFDAANHVQRVDLTDDLGGNGGMQIQMPQHSDNDITFEAQVVTREVPTDIELTLANNESVVNQTIELVVQAVADGATINTTAQDVAHLEDGTAVVAAHGDEAAPGLYVPIDFTAELVDTDATEGVTQIVITLNGADAGARFVESGSLAGIATGGTITLSGVEYDTTVVGQTLTLDLATGEEGVAAGQNIDLNSQISIEFPIDDSTDFSTTFTVTTTEIDPDGASLANATSYTTTKTVEHVIEGVVGTAAAGFAAGMVTDYTEDGNNLINPIDGAADGGVSVDVAYEADTRDNDGNQQSEYISQIVLTQNSEGSFAVDAAKLALIDGGATTGTNTVAGVETLTITFVDTALQNVLLTGVVTVELGNDDSSDFILTGNTQTTELDDDTGGTVIFPSTFSGVESVNIAVLGVAETAEAGFAAGMVTDYTEDGNNLINPIDGAADGGVSVDVAYEADTRDNDGNQQSEYISQIVLTQNSEGSFAVDAAKLALIDGGATTGTNTVAGVETLTITFVDTALQNVLLTGVVTVELGNDDSSDFILTGNTQTTELDDDTGGTVIFPSTFSGVESVNIAVLGVAETAEAGFAAGMVTDYTEDGNNLINPIDGAADGGVSVDVAYEADTRDNDGNQQSEYISQIVLTQNSEGSFAVDAAKLALIDGGATTGTNTVAGVETL
ncbi:MAG: hypothetical protein ABW148_18105, partial [Sedimenticola sp.]